MGESKEQAEFRRHLSEMRQAAQGLGHDFAREFSDLDRKIERFGNSAARDARDLASDIGADFARLGRSMDEEIRRLPHRIAGAGVAIGSGTARVAGAVRDGVVDAGHRAKEGTKNALASAAGVKRTPMRSWTPTETEKDEPPKGEQGG